MSSKARLKQDEFPKMQAHDENEMKPKPDEDGMEVRFKRSFKNPASNGEKQVSVFLQKGKGQQSSETRQGEGLGIQRAGGADHLGGGEGSGGGGKPVGGGVGDDGLAIVVGLTRERKMVLTRRVVDVCVVVEGGAVPTAALPAGAAYWAMLKAGMATAKAERRMSTAVGEQVFEQRASCSSEQRKGM
ncbi:hypothetical protein L249_0857 [Ophiocordyceps polyrhachis-furcata BCC 54312]|uniref:Uncharacterized protein n=1 Tax=Ophiocordyceps polyrhachis-furcata BCC 54312 TaxID=1330021 RepID=A0A367LE71_9HYPO|nr:hypothetical protein L249_0857 [Ophiocordyceps polyrhachis-furcata BCC 54312]